jgi:uncharacterized protein (TIGR02001 family)
MFVLAGAMGASAAGAQLSGTLSALSDYRYRGVSLSQQKPAVQASVGYDDPSGFYGGLFGSTVELAGESTTSGQALVYLGWVTPIGSGLHWDLGGDYSAFSDGRGYDFGELYTGITTSNFNVRLHYSPDYFGSDRSSWYAEVNGSVPLGDDFALFAHLGVLVPVGQGAYPPTSGLRNPVDASVGVGRDFGGFTVQIAWVGTSGTGALYPLNGTQPNPYGTGGLYPLDGTQRRNTVVGSLSWSF